MMIHATINRLRKIAVPAARVARVTALGISLLVAGDTLAGGFGQHFGGESAAHRCSGCATGQCQPKSSTYGHHRPSWRRWPGATDYEGFKPSTPNVSVPDVRIPNELNEGRLEPKTRSNKPLDPEVTYGSPVVPEFDTPGGTLGPDTGMGDSGIGGAGMGNAGSGAGPFGNIGGEEALPDGAAEAGNAFESPQGMGGAPEPGNIFNDGGAGAPDDGGGFPGSNEPATPLFDSGPTDDGSGGIDFDSSINRRTNKVVSRNAVQSIKNRTPQMLTAKPALQLDLAATTQTSSPVPSLGIAGGLFSSLDLIEPGSKTTSMAAPKPQTKSKPEEPKQSVSSNSQPTQATPEVVQPVVYEDKVVEALPEPESTEYVATNRNPLRKTLRIRKSSHTPAPVQQTSHVESVAEPQSQMPTKPLAVAKPLAVSKPLATTKLVPSNDVQLQPVPKSEPASTVEVEDVKLASTSTGMRSLAQSGRHSLRDSLRKNPLR